MIVGFLDITCKFIYLFYISDNIKYLKKFAVFKFR